MKVVNIREARATLASLIEEAQNEPVCLARQGKPVAVLQGWRGMIWKRSCSNIRVRSGRRSKDDASRRGPGAPWRPFAADYFADDGVLGSAADEPPFDASWAGVYATSVCCVALTS